ncbi:MAG: FAD-dependent oxidoreductase [Gaiellaceae bacterium]
MAERKPVLLAVDDDREVVRAIERDLRNHYSRDFTVLAAGSGEEALELIRRLVPRGDPLALVVTDQRMPKMTGVELLAHVAAEAPDAKRVLLTAYADTEVAMRAINDIRLDHYFMKPWHPPEERLYPVLDDLLEDWHAAASHAPRLADADGDAVCVIGDRLSADSQRVRDLLANNQIAYRWLDVEDSRAGQMLSQASLTADRLPVVLVPDTEPLVNPDPAEVAERIGLQTDEELAYYDLVVVGAGPAGLAAAVYGASEGLRTVVVERQSFGGQAGMSSRIENYLGFPAGLSGADLARRATTQARRFGSELLTAQEAVAIDVVGSTRVVQLADGSSIASHTVLLAPGVSYRRLDAVGADRLTGRGIWYGTASTGDAALLNGQEAFVVGGANSAGQAALHLARATRVTILYRGESLQKSMSQYLVDRIESVPDEITVRLRAEVREAHGEDELEEITIDEGGKLSRVPATAMFVFVGAEPHTDWLGNAPARSERGFILTGEQVLDVPKGCPPWPLKHREPFALETSIPGVFAAGDVRDQSIKRVASAVGEGSMAVLLVHKYLKDA